MFFHSLKYAVKKVLKNKMLLLWTAIFPIALSTFMWLAFGEVYNKDVVFKKIPVSVVVKSEQENFHKLMDKLSEKDDAIFDVKYEDEKTAIDNLEKENVTAIIYESKDMKVVTLNNDYKEQVVKQVVSQYKKTVKVITDIAKYDFTKINAAVEKISSETRNYCREEVTSKGNQNPYLKNFYAIFAMSCMFAAYGAAKMASELRPDLSSLAMRRSITSTSKSIMVLAEFVIMWVYCTVIECIAYTYMRLIGVTITGNILALLVIFMAGTAIGIAIGVLLGCLPKLKETTRSGLITIVTMALSVLADLCMPGVKSAIEHSVPILNRINPAALISDAMYSLGVFDDYTRFVRDVSILGAMVVVLLGASFWLLRRNSCESL